MKISTTLGKKAGMYYVVLSYYNEENKRRQKWISTGISVEGNNKRKANQKLDEIRMNYSKYISVPVDKNEEADMYIEEYMQKWLERHKNKIEENTYDSYKIIVDKIDKYFSGKKIRLKELKPAHIQKFYDDLREKGLSGNTVLHYHANIRTALKSAVKLDIIQNNPADKVDKPKKEQFIAKYYTEEEIEKLFKVVKGDSIEIVVLLASYYGLRRSEVLGLQWSSIDFENNSITIHHKVIETTSNGTRTLLYKDKTKNKSSYRTLPLLPEIKNALLKHKEKIEENRKMFGNAYNNYYRNYICVNAEGKVFRPEYITDHFALVMKNNKEVLRKIRFHDLRHSCASLLLAKGIGMKDIQEWLGHSTYSTTANYYSHLDKNYKENIAEVLSSSLKLVNE